MFVVGETGQLQQKSDHKPEVEEMERRLNVLQSRFDRQKQHLETLRHQEKVSESGVNYRTEISESGVNYRVQSASSQI